MSDQWANVLVDVDGCWWRPGLVQKPEPQFNWDLIKEHLETSRH